MYEPRLGLTVGAYDPDQDAGEEVLDHSSRGRDDRRTAGGARISDRVDVASDTAGRNVVRRAGQHGVGSNHRKNASHLLDRFLILFLSDNVKSIHDRAIEFPQPVRVVFRQGFFRFGPDLDRVPARGV
jgi:hypothetical protein